MKKQDTELATLKRPHLDSDYFVVGSDNVSSQPKRVRQDGMVSYTFRKTSIQKDKLDEAFDKFFFASNISCPNVTVEHRIFVQLVAVLDPDHCKHA